MQPMVLAQTYQTKMKMEETLKYREIMDGIFLDRPNRFIAHVDVNGTVETVHVKNTGRCKELLLPGAAALLCAGAFPQRQALVKTPGAIRPGCQCQHRRFFRTGAQKFL